MKNELENLKKEYEKRLEEYEKEYKYADDFIDEDDDETVTKQYWEGAIHSVELIIQDLEEILKK